MIIALMVAMGKNHVIGKDNQLPWHLPADLAHFKAITMGKPIVMGRKTFESIGKPLPGRRNVVISRQNNRTIPGCEVFQSIDEALRALSEHDEVMIIGGANIFEQTLSLANKLYVTVIEAEFDGDAFFPTWDEKQWKIISDVSHEPDAKNSYAYRFLELERVSWIEFG